MPDVVVLQVAQAVLHMSQCPQKGHKGQLGRGAATGTGNNQDSAIHFVSRMVISKGKV